MRQCAQILLATSYGTWHDMSKYMSGISTTLDAVLQNQQKYTTLPVMFKTRKEICYQTHYSKASERTFFLMEVVRKHSITLCQNQYARKPNCFIKCNACYGLQRSNITRLRILCCLTTIEIQITFSRGLFIPISDKVYELNRYLYELKQLHVYELNQDVRAESGCFQKKKTVQHNSHGTTLLQRKISTGNVLRTHWQFTCLV